MRIVQATPALPAAFGFVIVMRFRPDPLRRLESGSRWCCTLGRMGHDDGSVTCPKNSQVDVGWS